MRVGLLRPLARRSAALGQRALATQRFPVPELGAESITEGMVLELHKKVGDYVAVEDKLAEVETDKVTVEVKAPASGTITKWFFAVDDTIEVGADLIEIDLGIGEGSAAVAAPPPPTAAAAVDEAAAAATAPAASPSSVPASAASAASTVRYHPSGRPSLMTFPPRGAARAALRAASPSVPASTPIAAALSARFGEEKAVAGAILYTELPARFHRPRLSEEEMDAIDSGGADYVF